MKADLDKARIEAILESAVQQLDGDWVLLGGALVAVWVDAERRTEDIDLVGLQGPGDRNRLLDFAVSLGIPVEALNSAADFFLEKIPNWREQLVLWRTGARGRIFRPSPTLFICLKARRLSEQDFEDCLKVLAASKKAGDVVDVARVNQTLGSLPETAVEAIATRRKALLGALGAPASRVKGGPRRPSPKRRKKRP